jgi:hypothetical protein
MAETTELHSPRVAQRLTHSEHVLHWVHANLDGMQIPALSDDKRIQLASACWHMAVEHSMSIVVLVDQGMYGTAMALIPHASRRTCAACG